MAARGAGSLNADRRRGERAGLPELEHLLQAGENALQGGEDQGNDGVWTPGAILPCLHDAMLAGDLSAEGEVLMLHANRYNKRIVGEQGKNRRGWGNFRREGKGKDSSFCEQKEAKKLYSMALCEVRDTKGPPPAPPAQERGERRFL